MLSEADNYIFNPSGDYNVHKIIFAGKERFVKCINLIKNAWDSYMFDDLLKNNHSPDINSVLKKNLNTKNIRVFVFKVLSSIKKVG